MSDNGEEGKKHERALFNNRLRKRQITLLRKFHQFHEDFGVQVYAVIYHNCRFHVYSSQPSELWPPPLQEIKQTYPLPTIHIAEVCQPRQRKRNNDENHRFEAITSLLPSQSQNSVSSLNASCLPRTPSPLPKACVGALMTPAPFPISVKKRN